MTDLVPSTSGHGFGKQVSIGVTAFAIILSLLALSRCSLFSKSMPAPPSPSPGIAAPKGRPATPSPGQPQPTATPPAGSLGPAPVAGRTYLHEPFAKEQCGTCHDLTNKEDPTRLWGPVVEVCRVCHWKVIDAEQPTHVHDPFPEGKCLSCHNPHASDQAFLLKAPQAQVCRDCHNEVPKQPHPSVASEECLLCHAGHGSDQPAILREPQAELCARCHADHTQQGAAFGPHAEKAKECTLCHKPHTGEFQDGVVSVGCRKCHEDVVVAVPPVSHKPVVDGECLTCHVFHQKDQFALLAKPQPAICRQCHKLGKPVKQTHPNIAPGECLLCHTGHGGDQVALLRIDERTVCSTCHEDKVKAVQGSVRPHFESKNLPLCGSCHNPHDGSQDPIKLTEVCARCHTDEAPPIPALRQASPSIHQPMRKEGCVACHDFHKVKAGHPIGAISTNDFCLKCHGNLSHGAHPVSGRPDPWHGGELSCDSCHSPHDTPFPANLLASGDALCLECHKLGQ